MGRQERESDTCDEDEQTGVPEATQADVEEAIENEERKDEIVVGS